MKKKPMRVEKSLVPLIEIVEEGEDLDHLFSTFGVNDESDIEDILSGSVGEAEW